MTKITSFEQLNAFTILQSKYKNITIGNYIIFFQFGFLPRIAKIDF